jgi:hypothetical protein
MRADSGDAAYTDIAPARHSDVAAANPTAPGARDGPGSAEG